MIYFIILVLLLFVILFEIEVILKRLALNSIRINTFIPIILATILLITTLILIIKNWKLW